MARRNTPAGLIYQGFQRIATNSTATGLNSTVAAGQAFLISVETQSIRLRFDSTAPTANTGILLIAANSPFWIDGVKGSTVKIARATAGAIVNVQSWTR
jgi:hypothetical protein